MATHPSQLVSARSNDYSFFGEDALTFRVHVLPAPPRIRVGGVERVFEVSVDDENVDAMNGEGGVLRSEREFSILHQALQAVSAKFSEPMPHLPLKPSLLGDPAPRAELVANDLQVYLVGLVAHPEVRDIDAFKAFVQRTSSPPESTEASVVHSSSPGAPRMPTVVRTRSKPRSSSSDAEVQVTSKVACTKVKLSWEDEQGTHECELPVLTPSSGMGNRVIDVRALAQKSGFFTRALGWD